MKRFFLTAIAFAALAMPAAAADQSPPSRQVTPPASKPACTWCGWYVGGHAGYGWGKTDPEIDITPFSSPEQKGWAFGGHTGYLWQYGQIAGGLEVDYTSTDLKQDQSAALGGGGASIGLHTKYDALASVRGRGGVILGNDLFLYGTGGIGFAKSKASIDFCGTTCMTVASAAESNWGWVLGGGAEYQIIKNVVLGAEFLHYDFGTTQYNFALNPNLTVPLTFGIKADNTVNLVRARLGVRF